MADAGIIPAYAGSTPCPSTPPGPARDHPRIRGEHSARPLVPYNENGSSPHTRGALALVEGAGDHARIIPAYAGSTPTGAAGARPGTDHPRIRGEHCPLAGPVTNTTGSSPHTRGAQKHLDRPVDARGIIPAYAGSTMCLMSYMDEIADHPRIRGEHLVTRDQTLVVGGSSPHTRGAPRSTWPRRRQPGIIPAYAGSTSARASSSYQPSDHPRIRGEHLNSGAAHRVAQGSSPHTRGALDAVDARGVHVWIIPAYAGSTIQLHQSARPEADHPRIRGEHE